jgi:hypothetical protein
VSEIRKLRESLTHRIQILHSANTTDSDVPVFVSEENIENVNPIETDIPLSTAAENQTITTVESKTTELPTTELVQQIHQTRELLAQLQVIPNNNKIVAQTTKDKPKKNKLSETPRSQTEFLKILKLFFPPLGVLKILNTVLTCCGFLGILFSLRYLEHNNSFGSTMIIIASLTLVIVGFLGRFYVFAVHEKRFWG